MTLDGMTWPDGQARYLAGGTAPRVSAIFGVDVDGPDESFPYYLTSHEPHVTFSGSALAYAPIGIGDAPGLPAGTLGFEINGVLLTRQSPVGVEDAGAPVLAMAAPYPNPARSFSALRWTMPRDARADLDVLDTSGRRVRTLIAGTASRGPNLATWDLRDDAGRRVAPGLYFARLRIGRDVRATRIAVLR
jgi:hypothetical protein